MKRLCIRLLVGLALLGLPLPAAPQAGPERLIAIADIHGAGGQFRALLEQAELLDASGHWAGGGTTFVQTGDFTDRGGEVRAVMDLLMRLEREAPAGRVRVLLGNHETMNLMAEVRDVTAEIFASFADDQDDAAARRERAYADYEAWANTRVEELGRPLPDRQTREQWMEAHPLGFLEYMDALGQDGTYGEWLRSKPIAAQIGDTIFLHGGLDPDSPLGSVSELNEQAREEIARFDRYRRHLIERGVILPFSTYSEMLIAIALELEAWSIRLRLSPGPPDPRAEPLTFTPREREHLEILIAFQSLGSWLIVDPAGPLWFRGFARWSNAQGESLLTSVLEHYGATRVVVGHTVTGSRRIAPRFGDRVFLIDTGMLLSAYQGRASALELNGGEVTAIYSRSTRHPRSEGAVGGTGKTARGPSRKSSRRRSPPREASGSTTRPRRPRTGGLPRGFRDVHRESR